MQTEWEAALQKQRERVDFAYGQHNTGCCSIGVYYRDCPTIATALDDLIRLAQAIGAAEAKGCTCVVSGGTIIVAHNLACPVGQAGVIIRELGVE